ncbi:hypothetical protein O7627_04260 [Solwaraspora sp. WMMD1047]|uniref:hypothetical protein n=1 Tax=Solwaraspora sp. WMMD1047 TaxID=3016102 RepID=UPI00241705B0|nr:hypothetical protein [Solwaraspora sp. WMMD1047]MDG4828517.1 hypothetical protein [Solwaraspora sp. WMMD1047]
MGESVGVVVLGVLAACGGEVSGELCGGDDRTQVVAQCREEFGRSPDSAAEQGMDVEVVAGGPAVVEGSSLAGGGVGQVDDDRAETGDDDWRILPVVLSEVKYDLLSSGGLGDEELA